MYFTVKQKVEMGKAVGLYYLCPILRIIRYNNGRIDLQGRFLMVKRQICKTENGEVN
jgi:hypothetical protein